MGDFMKKTQSPPKLTQTDPFVHLRPQQAMVEDALRRQTSGGVQGFGSPYAGPSPQQTAMLDTLANFQTQAMPAYGTGVTGLERTAGGAYLDPTQTSQYQNFRNTQQGLANMMFGDTADAINAQLAAQGAARSSARQKQLGGAAGEIGGRAAQGVAQAGWQRYAAERALQDQAAALGTELAPGLAGQVFQNEETLRAAQQRANIDQMKGQLEQMGLDKQAIDTVLRYMQVAAGRAVPYVVGPSPWEQFNTALSSTPGGSFGKPSQSGTPTFSPTNIEAQRWGYM